MDRQEKKLAVLLKVCSSIYAITVLYGFYMNYLQEDMNALAMTLVACFTPWIVPIVFKLLRFKPIYEIYIINIVFVYFASLIGSSFHGYSLFGFDKALHFSSGFMFTIVGMLMFMFIKNVRHIEGKEDYHLFLVFINAINLSVAALWEFYEYFILIMFDNDAINHYSQGVHDSMNDMLCACLAGLILTGFIMYSYKKGTSNYVMKICEKFYRLNIEPRRI